MKEVARKISKLSFSSKRRQWQEFTRKIANQTPMVQSSNDIHGWGKQTCHVDESTDLCGIAESAIGWRMDAKHVN
jgi:hypothetical protein